MQITLTDTAKHFGREGIFKNLQLELRSGSRTVILGPNGSGKSTLIQVIAGAIIPTSGSVSYQLNNKTLQQEDVYEHISIAAPYLGIYEDLSLEQALTFHARFKPFRNALRPEAIAKIAYLDHALKKPVTHFSSGMKQRLKLALAILSNTPLLLLDEPTSNLDTDAVEWYGELLAEHIENRTLVVASNRQKAEYALCTDVVEMERLK